MSAENQKSWVLILIAVIGVIGTMGGALIANWDKFSPSSEEPVASTESANSDSAKPTAEISIQASSSDNVETATNKQPVEPREAEKQEVKLDAFTMTLQRCERTPGDNVDCYLLVQPNQDIYFSLRCQYQSIATNILDSSGIDHKCSSGKFGSDEDERELNKSLSQGKPVAAVFTFNDVPSDVKDISGITVYYNFTVGREWQGMPYASELIEFDETEILSN